MPAQKTDPAAEPPNDPAESGSDAAARRMPADFSISLAAKGGSDQLLLHPSPERLQSMRGYDATYSDIIDYIVRITHRIWEEKDIGYIYDTYRHNSKVYDDVGLQYGRDKIVADTVHTINGFPDIRLYADEIIWAGDDSSGFHTSHRTVISGHNSGYTRYGAPTGKKITAWCIANCVSIENEIFAEWVIYDSAHLISQLGFDLRGLAREYGNQMGGEGFNTPRAGEPERLPGQGKPPYLPPPASGFDIEEFIRRSYHNIWNRRSLREIARSHLPTLRFRGANGRVFYGRGQYQAFILSMLAMFPDLMLQIDDLYWMGSAAAGYRVAVRWSIVGTHRGMGIYGAPTGRQVAIWGISQHEIRDGQIAAEWMLFNEFALMQQIYRD